VPTFSHGSLWNKNIVAESVDLCGFLWNKNIVTAIIDYAVLQIGFY